jgi:hypothetical protein
MHRLAPVTLIPGHGPVIVGQERVAQILSDGGAGEPCCSDARIDEPWGLAG